MTDRAPMTIIICRRGRRRTCERIRVAHCPDCQGVIDLDAKQAHQCTLPLDLPGGSAP